MGHGVVVRDFCLAQGGGVVQGSQLSAGPAGPGAVGEEVEGLTLDVTGHVGRS